MSALITPPTTDLPLRGATVKRFSGIKSAFGRRAAQILIAATGAGMLGAPTVAGDAYPVEGYWLTKGGGSIVEIAACAESRKRLCGTVVWSADGQAGAQVLTSFRLSGNKAGDKWAKGKILVAGAKKAKPGKLTVKGDTLKVSVCKGAKCKSKKWSRPSASMTAQAGLTGRSS